MRKFILMGLAALTVAGSAGVAGAQPRPMGDRDHDGVPNVVDPRNNNRGPMGDRDHDGRPNAADPRNNNRGAMGDRDHDGRPNVVDRRDDRWDPSWGRETRAPRHWGGRPGWYGHVRQCRERYRSYDLRTDTFMVRRGVTARCRL